MISVDVQYADHKLTPPSRELVKTWVRSAFLDDDQGELTVRIVDADEMLELNTSYRKIEKVTNVLSFPADWDTEEGAVYLGDIAICGEVVDREASEQRKAKTAHWAHMVIHGVLHLLGYDHESDHDAQLMESLEIELLAKLSFDNPYASDQRQFNTQEHISSNERRTG